MKKIFTVRDLKHQQAHMWDSRHIEDEVRACGERSIKHCFMRYLPRYEDILEAGCGLGAWVKFLSEKGYRVTGIDHDTSVIERVKQAYPDLNVHCGSIERLAYSDNSLGAYISLGVVEHFEGGPDSTLKEAFRVLKPGGRLILTVPYNNLFRKCIAHPLRSVYLFLHRIRGGEIHFAEYRYSEAEAREMVERAGFSIIETGMDDFISKTDSLTLWSEFPWLQAPESLYALTRTGRAIAFIFNSLSRKILSSGILIIAEKRLSAVIHPFKNVAVPANPMIPAMKRGPAH